MSIPASDEQPMSATHDPVVTEEQLAALQLLGGSALARHGLELGAHTLIEQGLDPQAVESLAAWSNIPVETLLEVIALSPQAHARRKTAGEQLSPFESDRMFRIARVMLQTSAAFEDNEIVREWLLQPNSALGGRVPLELLSTDAGAMAVVDVLGRIEDGIYS